VDTNWEKSVMEKILLETINEQRRSRRWRLFFRFLWLGVIIAGLCYFMYDRKSPIIDGRYVAVVNLKGIISYETNTYQNVADGLLAALKDKEVVGVIIRANSPGGSPVHSRMLYDEILRLRKLYPKKTINVVIEDVCASGCYYISAAANKIYANPASIVGSIGVIYTGFGLTGLMQKMGVDSRLITAGKNKAMGYPFIPENKEQSQMQQKMLDQVHQQFITAVKNGRGKRLSNDTDLFSGRYWVGEDAVKLGLIDGFASVETLARDQFKTENIVDYTPEQDPFERVAKKIGVSVADVARQAAVSLNMGSYN
jgi:protease IV